MHQQSILRSWGGYSGTSSSRASPQPRLGEKGWAGAALKPPAEMMGHFQLSTRAFSCLNILTLPRDCREQSPVCVPFSWTPKLAPILANGIYLSYTSLPSIIHTALLLYPENIHGLSKLSLYIVWGGWLLSFIFYSSVSFSFSFPNTRSPDQVLMKSMRVTNFQAMTTCRKLFDLIYMLHVDQDEIKKNKRNLKKTPLVFHAFKITVLRIL